MSFDGLGHSIAFVIVSVSIPFEQGDVFRRKTMNKLIQTIGSQSLSSRAMSFDVQVAENESIRSLNPFRAGRCLSTL